MRVWPLFLAVSGLALGGCFRPHARMTTMKLPEFSADPERLPFTVSRDGGFYGGTFSGRIPAGQRADGLFTYELYYLLTIADGRDDTLCREADFKLRGIVIERRNEEMTGVHFLKELTGRLDFTGDKPVAAASSPSPSFSIPETPDAIQIAPGASAARFNIQYRPPGAEASNAFSLVFELRLAAPRD